jgi:predicted alternative tryptophan synthase beta-subunit
MKSRRVHSLIAAPSGSSLIKHPVHAHRDIHQTGIAAAPDLLAAMEAMMAAEYASQAWKAACRHAHTAIAKAKGLTQ